VSKDFVRIGKWFIQPCDGPDRFSYMSGPGGGPTAAPGSKSTHLSFSFHYFIHGESSVCASVDVRQHPPVRKLSLHHLNIAKGQTTPVQVMLAPYGLSATLTGVTYKRDDRMVERLLKDWNQFFRLSRNKYFCANAHGDPVQMPAAVEVMVAGVRLVYPTSYVLVSDMDIAPEMAAFGAGAGVNAALPKTMQTCQATGT
jgi:mediator of RNA polymerase II transcription subunit 13